MVDRQTLQVELHTKVTFWSNAWHRYPRDNGHFCLQLGLLGLPSFVRHLHILSLCSRGPSSRDRVLFAKTCSQRPTGDCPLWISLRRINLASLHSQLTIVVHLPAYHLCSIRFLWYRQAVDKFPSPFLQLAYIYGTYLVAERLLVEPCSLRWVMQWRLPPNGPVPLIPFHWLRPGSRNEESNCLQLCGVHNFLHRIQHHHHIFHRSHLLEALASTLSQQKVAYARIKKIGIDY